MKKIQLILCLLLLSSCSVFPIYNGEIRSRKQFVAITIDNLDEEVLLYLLQTIKLRLT